MIDNKTGTCTDCSRTYLAFPVADGELPCPHCHAPKLMAPETQAKILELLSDKYWDSIEERYKEENPDRQMHETDYLNKYSGCMSDLGWLLKKLSQIRLLLKQ